MSKIENILTTIVKEQAPPGMFLSRKDNGKRIEIKM
jgi:hypothetical protein